MGEYIYRERVVRTIDFKSNESLWHTMDGNEMRSGMARQKSSQIWKMPSFNILTNE